MKKWRATWAGGEIRDGGRLEEVEVHEDGEPLIHVKNAGCPGTWLVTLGPDVVFTVRRYGGRTTVRREPDKPAAADAEPRTSDL